MGDLELLLDLNLDGERQGPGGDDETRLAIELAGLRGAGSLNVGDLGCGTGASTLVLARELDAHILAVDLYPEFLQRLDAEAATRGLDDRITTLTASIDDLPIMEGSLDVVWSEGAIYNIGFEHGVRTWRTLLRPGGVLAVSELTWLTRERPAELDAHWSREYPGVAMASAKIAVLETAGFSLLGYFPLPERCWLDHYYRPLQRRFDDFLTRHDHSDAARSVVEAELTEITLYERYGAYVGYGFYVARRTD